MLEQAKAFIKDVFLGDDYERDHGKVIESWSEPNARFNTWDPPRLGNYLPYISYDSTNRLFVNRDGLGFVLEVLPQTGANDEMTGILAAIYSKCPEGTGIQFQLLPSPEIRPLLADYGRMRQRDPDAAEKALEFGREARHDNIYRRFARRRVGHFLKHSQVSLTKGFNYLLRNFRLVISVSIPGSIDTLDRVQRALLLRDSIMSSLKTVNLPAAVMDVDQTLDYMDLIANPHRMVGKEAIKPRMPANHDTGRELRHQVFDRDVLRVEQAYRILFSHPGNYLQGKDDTIDVRMLSFTGYPKHVRLSQMASIIGDSMNAAMQYSCPFLITLGVMVLDPEKTKAWAVANQLNATKNANSDMARVMPDLGKKKADWDKTVDAIDDGGGLVSLYHQVALFSKPDMAVEASELATAIWRTVGFRPIDAQLHQLPSYLACFPMILSEPFHKDLKRMGMVTHKTTSNAINTAPMLAEWKGTPTPVLLFAGRRGQVMGLDLFDNQNGNKNAAIMGTPGAGKSTLLNEIAWSYLSIGALVMAYDLGRSMERLCKVVGGQYVDIGEREDICFNPFSTVDDIREDMEMIKPMLAVMASPRGLIDDFQYRALESAALRCFGKYGRDTTITNIRDLLATGRLKEGDEQDRRLTDLAVMLEPYTKDGVYGRYFEGKANVNFGGDMIVFENESLSRKKDLQSVITLMSLYNITGAMFLDRSRRKLFIIDEFYQQIAGLNGDSEYLAQAVTAAALRARKHGGALVTASQYPEHYYESKAGLAAWNASDWKFFSRLSPEQINHLAATGRVDMNHWKQNVLKSLRGAEGVYSEWVITSPLGESAARFIIDPYTLLMFSNRHEDNAPLDARIAQGMTIEQAIDATLRERGVI